MRALVRMAVAFCVIASGVFAQQSPNIAPAGNLQISGVTLDSVSNQPLAGVSVLIAPVEDPRSTQTARTTAEGRFAFSQLKAGKYQLVANHRGYPGQAFNQHDGFSTAIAVAPGQDTSRIVFRLRREASIHGNVTDEENDPVQNVSVQLFAAVGAGGTRSNRMVGNAMTDDQGSYRFPHLPEGKYYVAVSGQPWYWAASFPAQPQPETAEDSSSDAKARMVSATPNREAAQLDKLYPLTFYGGALDCSNPTAIDLDSGENASADIPVRAVPAVHVHVTRPAPPPEAAPGDGQPPPMVVSSGNPLERVQLYYKCFDGSLINVDTQISGGPDGLQMEIAPGRYVAQLQGAGTSRLHEVELDSDMEFPSLRDSTQASITGTAEYEETPPSSIVVALANRQTSRQYVLNLGGKAEFRFEEPIMPGRYEIAVGNAPGWYLRSLSVSGAKLSGRTVQIGGSQPVHFTLKLANGIAQLDGVAKRDGKPWAGAMIVLVPQNASENAVLFRRDQSDSDGTFTLRDVVPGSYKLVAIENGWKLAWSDPKILQPYLASAESLQVAPGAKLHAAVQVQDAR